MSIIPFVLLIVSQPRKETIFLIGWDYNSFAWLNYKSSLSSPNYHIIFNLRIIP